MRTIRTFPRRAVLGLAAVAALALAAGAGPAQADLLEDAKAGKNIRIGYSNEAPYAFQNDSNQMDGFVNIAALEILKRLGTENVEGVLTEWGSLIPGLKAGRFDIITAGMYILPNRCEQVAFTEPMGVFAESFLVEKGNPKNIHSFDDVKNNPDITLVTGAGYSTVQHAKTMGIPDDQIMQVPDPASMLQALKAGRADVASATVFAIKDLAEKGGGDVEVATPFTAPDFTKGYSAFAFRKDDQAFVDAFNAAMKDYIGSPEFLAAVASFGYGEEQVPDGSVTTAELCKAE